MKTKSAKNGSKNAWRRVAREAEAGASGAVVGAVFGAAAGPPGIAVGAIIGSVAGALVGGAFDRDQAAETARTRELDDEIGVTEGDVGASIPRHPVALNPDPPHDRKQVPRARW